MQEALLKANLVTKEQVDAPVISQELHALWEEIEQLKIRLPENDSPSPFFFLAASALTAQGKQEEALQLVRNTMQRRLQELGIK